MKKKERKSVFYKEYDAETLKKVQQMELEILRDFQELCARHGIDYFAGGGTAIGAMRHNGMIPWDDDIDINLLRKDYENFIKYAKAEYSDKYLIVNAQENPEYPLMTTRWIKRGTKFKEESLKDLDIELGVFLDIYCFDNVPDNEFLRKLHGWMVWFLNKLMILKVVKRPVLYFGGIKAKVVYFICAIAHFILNILPVSNRFLYQMVKKELLRYNSIPTKRVAYYFDPTPFSSMIYVKDIKPTYEVSFEDGHIKVANHVDKYLTIRFGNYMELPPKEKRHNHPPYILELEDNKVMNAEKKVAVLLSAYNGEKYIAEQIESILWQDYPNIDLYVRDDCSTDSTLSILEEFEKKGQIILMRGEKNLGYPEGFYELMRTVHDADYFSFSDQDDVWEKDKISRAVKSLNKMDTEKPGLFIANYDICDENLNYIRTSSCLGTRPKFRNSLYACLGLGFTMVLNRSAKEMVINCRSRRSVTKDVWIGMLCSAFGEVVYDKKSCAKHRRNSGAFSAQDTTFVEIQKERFKKFFSADGFGTVYIVMQEFYDTFKSDLKKSDLKELTLLLNQKKTLINKIKKILYPHRLRYDWKDEIMLRIIFLMGKL